jgi:hypothetical protein
LASWNNVFAFSTGTSLCIEFLLPDYATSHPESSGFAPGNISFQQRRPER